MSKNSHEADGPEGEGIVGSVRAAPTRFVDYQSGDVIEQHRHRDHQLIYVGNGVIRVTTEAGSWVATPGRAVWIPAGQAHSHRFVGASRMHTVRFVHHPSALAADRPTVVAVTSLMRELIMAVTSGDRADPRAMRLRAVILDELAAAPGPALFLPVPRDDRLVAACRKVEADLSVAWTIGALAAECGCGERTLARLFRTEFGMTYPQWRTQVRLARAAALLAEGRSVTEVALRCAWQTPSAFIDVYRRSLGTTPGTTRTLHP